jgi:hypothetical protein
MRWKKHFLSFSFDLNQQIVKTQKYNNKFSLKQRLSCLNTNKMHQVKQKLLISSYTICRS